MPISCVRRDTTWAKDAVDADGGQHHCNRRERPEKEPSQARRRQCGIDDVLHRSHGCDRHVRIHLPHLVADAARHPHRVTSRPRDHEHAADQFAAMGGDRPLNVRNEELFPDDVCDAVVALVGDDADNGQPRAVGRAAQEDAAADGGRSVGPIRARMVSLTTATGALAVVSALVNSGPAGGAYPLPRMHRATPPASRPWPHVLATPRTLGRR
jgi:hypothetical protein